MAEESLLLRMKTEGARTFAADVSADAAAVKRVGDAADKSGRQFQRAGSRMTAAGQKMQRAGHSMTRNITAPMALAGAATVKLAVDFDKQMRNINSLLHLPESGLKRMRKDILALAGTTAQAPETLAKGMYDLASSGFEGEKGLKVLKASAIAASAGLTTTETSTKAVAGVLNAYKMPAEQAGHVSDVLFQTVNRGVVSFDELASTIGQTLSIAPKMGVSLEEVGAATATMTKQGVSGGEAQTRIRSLMQAMLKPTTNLAKAYKKMGVEGGEELIKKSGGLEGALQALYKQTGGNTKKMADLFGRTEAIQGAFALTGKNAKAAAADMKGMEDAAGASGRTFKEQSKSTAMRWQKLTSELKADAIEVGDQVLPVLEKIMDKVDSLVDSFKKLPAPMKKAAAWIAVGLAALGPLLIAGGAMGKAGGTLAKLFGKGKGGGALGAAGKAGVVPVFVTNWGGGAMKDTLGKGARGGALGKLARASKYLPGVAAGGSRAAGAVTGASAAAAMTGVAALGYYYRNKPKLQEGKGGMYSPGPHGHAPAPGFGAKPMMQRSMKEGVYRPPTKATNREIYGPPAPGPYVKAAAEQAGKAAARWSDTRPINLAVTLDGKAIASAVKREGTKDKARR